MTDLLTVGFSDAAETIRKVEQQIRVEQQETVTLSHGRKSADLLIDLEKECSADSWDGPGSIAVEPRTVTTAYKILSTLEWSEDCMEIIGEPDGHVNIEWYKSPRRILTMSIAPNSQVYWAAIIGSQEMRGRFPFLDKCPEFIQNMIDRICGR